MIKKAKVCALDQLLLERFGSKVGRGLAVQLIVAPAGQFQTCGIITGRW